MTTKVLCVDDEPNILMAFRRQLRQFDLETAVGAEAGLETLAAKGPFAVVVSDLRMPGMDGVEFLSRVKESSPDTVRIMLTGQADLRSASLAVNEGCIFRFLLKPCPSEVLSRALEAGLEQFRLVRAERDVLEQTLRGSVEVLSEVLSLVVPEAFGQALRMRHYVREMCQQMGVSDAWQYEVAAMLSQVGAISVPSEVLEKARLGEKLGPEDRRAYSEQFQAAYDLLAKIPRLEAIAQMVRGQDEAQAVPPGRVDSRVAAGIKMLRLARTYDDIIRAGNSPELAVTRMRVRYPGDGDLLTAMASASGPAASSETHRVRVAQLSPGMVLRADVRTRTGQLLLGKGQEITPSVIARLRGFAASSAGVAEPLSVTLPATGQTAG